MLNLLFLLIVLLTSAISDCQIAVVIPNRTGSQCVWSSLETMARHWGMTDLYDLSARYGHACGPGEVNSVLRARSHRFFWSPEGRFHDWSSLENASLRHWPVAVGLRGTHMLLLVDTTPDSVTIIDNSGSKAGVRQTWTRSHFDSVWDGWFVALDPR